MASHWANGLPVASVPVDGQAKRVTLVVPYYENAAFLRFQMRHWLGVSEALFPHVSVVVVDDGSPTSAASVVEAVKAGTESFYQPRLFRIEVDVAWNWLAARNIGAHHASDGWLLLTDMDHVVPVETMRRVVYGQHDPTVVYAFSRREHTGDVIPPHSASFLMTKAMFWKIGGYDEALSGHYGTDGEFRKQIKAKAPIVVLRDELIRYEYVDDSSTTAYQRKKPEDADAVRSLIAARGADWRPKTLSFPYREVAC